MALRIDAQGITLAPSVFRYEQRLIHADWDQVSAVVLWHQQLTGFSRMPYVGLTTRPGVPRLQGTGSGRGDVVMRALVPHIPTEVSTASIAVNGWRLDRELLAAVMVLVAPDVPLVVAD